MRLNRKDLFKFVLLATLDEAKVFIFLKRSVQLGHSPNINRRPRRKSNQNETDDETAEFPAAEAFGLHPTPGINPQGRSNYKNPHWIEFAKLLIEAVTLGVAFWGGYIYLKQLKVTQGQLNEMQNQSDVSKAQVTLMVAATKATENAAKTSQEQLMEMRAQDKMDQRAWVSPFEAHFINVDLDHIIFAVKVKNTGKTPAFNFVSMVAVHDSTNHFADGGEGRPGEFQSILAPGAEIDLISYSIERLSIKPGRIWWIWGVFWYDDIFGNSHSNQFNYFMQQYAFTNIFVPAGFHNTSDDMKTNHPSH